MPAQALLQIRGSNRETKVQDYPTQNGHAGEMKRVQEDLSFLERIVLRSSFGCRGRMGKGDPWIALGEISRMEAQRQFRASCKGELR